MSKNIWYKHWSHNTRGITDPLSSLNKYTWTSGCLVRLHKQLRVFLESSNYKDSFFFRVPSLTNNKPLLIVAWNPSFCSLWYTSHSSKLWFELTSFYLCGKVFFIKINLAQFSLYMSVRTWVHMCVYVCVCVFFFFFPCTDTIICQLQKSNEQQIKTTQICHFWLIIVCLPYQSIK